MVFEIAWHHLKETVVSNISQVERHLRPLEAELPRLSNAKFLPSLQVEHLTNQVKENLGALCTFMLELGTNWPVLPPVTR